MPRTPRSKTRRIEFSVFKDGDPVLTQLDQEATQRGVSLQQHIYDLLRARYMAQHGDSLTALLWTPDAAALSPAPSAAPLPPDAARAAARAAASVWLAVDDDD